MARGITLRLFATEEVSAGAAAELCEHLSAEGLYVSQGDEGGRATGGLLVFRSACERTLLRLRSLVAGSRPRPVIAWAMDAGLRPAFAMQLRAQGAHDVLFEGDGSAAEMLRSRLERWEEVELILDSPLVADNLVGRSEIWRQTLRHVIEVARYGSGNVLISGPTGSGKELVARLIHTLDPRRSAGPLVVVDCTTIVPTLSGSELFGHERGAFTHAIADRDGAVALANGGTLFLDEVGELPLALQAELLRAVQEQSYKRVGSNQWRKADFRLVCATNRELKRQGSSGEFRVDLYHRLATHTIDLPALEDRRDDILPLAAHFADPGHAHPERLFDPLVRAILVERSYPGNVRELQHLVQAMSLSHSGGGPISIGCLPPGELGKPEREGAGGDAAMRAAVRVAMDSGLSLRDMSAALGQLALEEALAASEGSVRGAAARLGITERAIHLRRSKAQGFPRLPDLQPAARRRRTSRGTLGCGEHKSTA